jgi:predicted amidohydrolase YtcJ
MKIITGSLFPILITAFCFLPVSQKTDTADLVFKNGNIYTANERQPKAEAVAVKAEHIVFVGSNRDAQKYLGKSTRVIDLSGNTLLPGLTDAHHHLSGVGFREMTLNLEGTTSLEDFLAKVKAQVEQTSPAKWVTGRGWIETFWQPPVFPTRWDLDKVAPNNPLFLNRADGHGAVANSAALKIAGIDKATPNPFGGEISKDKESGTPNGMLLDAAQGLVRRHIPATTPEEAERAIVLGVKRDTELGWTQVQDPGGSYEEVELFEKLYREGKIKLLIYNALSAPGKEAQRLFREGAVIGAYGNHLTVRAIKLYADVSLG